MKIDKNKEILFNKWNSEKLLIILKKKRERKQFSTFQPVWE